MLKVAIVLFAVAAIGGLVMATMHFRGRTPPPLVLALLHGALAASGLILLLLAVIRAGAAGTAAVALGLFVLAALGGFTLLGFHLRGRTLPNALVAGHGLLAVAGFLTLLAAVFAAS